jgi:hypothetical protein
MTISSAQPQPPLVLKCDKQPQKSDKGWINPQKLFVELVKLGTNLSCAQAQVLLKNQYRMAS